MDQTTNSVIESIGAYLPAQSLSTGEVLAGCKKPIRFPLEKITGIRTRRIVGAGEFSIDLARKAIEECLRMSKYQPADIDLLVCCNISRCDDQQFIAFEPCTSIRLKRDFGFTNALVFDLSNACAGMFTGIYVVDAFLRAGVIRRGMVVSGEYISHLTETAQKEIANFQDKRLACLTLGDAGAALILEKATDDQTGFQEIHLQTFGEYSQYCVGKASDQGGMIMYTDSGNLTKEAIKSGAKQAVEVLDRKSWSFDTVQHLIMHQTSKMTLRNAKREINRLLESGLNGEVNVINNLAERGNTASTSHFIALSDQIRSGKVKAGDRVLFSIAASGLTTGTALYTFDDLPDRSRAATLTPMPKLNGKPTLNGQSETRNSHRRTPPTPRLRVESVGTLPKSDPPERYSLTLLQQAATNCLKQSTYQSGDIDVVIYCGVYRSDYVLEPAYAAMLAGQLGMNTTLAFDVFNGALGFLDACYIVQQLMAVGKCRRAMIVAAEFENNADLFPGELVGVRETASAIIVDCPSPEQQGFSRFFFWEDVDSMEAYTTGCDITGVIPRMRIEKDPQLKSLYIDRIVHAVRLFLQREKLDIQQIDTLFPPQISSDFIGHLRTALGIPPEKCIDVVGAGPDLFTSSFPYALDHIRDKGATPGSGTSLIISVGSGIQVGCALYYHNS